MSYCRLSSDNGYCDIYCYESVYGGIEIHVASRRQPEGCPTDPWELLVSDNDKPDYEAYKNAEKTKRDWLESITYEELNLPSAGKSFNCCSYSEAAEKLLELREEGLNVPQYAIDALLEDAKEYEGD